MICEKCFSRYDGVCQSVTCVRNRQAEAERNARRGIVGKASSKEEPDKAPLYYNPVLQSEGRGENIRVIRTKHAE